MAEWHEKKERNAMIYALYCEGMKQHEIGALFGIGRQRTSDIIRMIRKRLDAPPAENRATCQKPQEPAQEPLQATNRPEPDPLYVHELKRRQPGGERFGMMWRTTRCYTHPPGGMTRREMLDVYHGWSLTSRRAA